MSSFAVLFRRELALSWGRGGGPLLAISFYAAMATLLPLATGPAPDRLAIVAPGSAWLALALASLLSLERLFERDYEDGALDLLALGPAPLEAVAFAKCLAQWIVTGAPLALAAPVAAIALGASPTLSGLIVVTALIGGLGFAFCGGIGAALSIGSPARRRADRRHRPAPVRPAGDLRRRRHRGLCRAAWTGGPACCCFPPIVSPPSAWAPSPWRRPAAMRYRRSMNSPSPARKGFTTEHTEDTEVFFEAVRLQCV